MGLSSPANWRKELRGFLGAEGSFRVFFAFLLLILGTGGEADTAAPAVELEAGGKVSEGVEIGDDMVRLVVGMLKSNLKVADR